MGCYRFLLASFLFACLVRADPVYTYTATSVTLRCDVGAGDSSIVASGPGFSFSGGVDGYLPTFFQVGDQVVPLDFGFLAESDDAGADVDFGGFMEFTNDVSGSVQLVTNGILVIPPNPDINVKYTFAASLTGGFTVLPSDCGPEGGPPCGTVGNIVVAGPGQVTLQIIGGGPTTYIVTESFTGSPVPEPGAGTLSVIGAAAIAGVLLAHRRKRLCGNTRF